MTKDKLIIALDMPEKKTALELIDKLEGTADFFKIGMELGLRVDDEFIKSLVKRGKKIFIDYKYYDIGNTIEKAVKNASDLGIYMLTIHAEKQVIEAAARGKKNSDLKVFAVTVLTSLGEDYADDYGTTVKDLTLRRAEWANNYGADGVISSPLEAGLIRTQFPKLLVCTPGIRPVGADQGDQNRSATPADAIRAGADYLVVGRPITRAENPVQATQNILEEMQQ